jgi:hypothetical protein
MMTDAVFMDRVSGVTPTQFTHLRDVQGPLSLSVCVIRVIRCFHVLLSVLPA